jgi:hypothetical protein
MKKGEIMNGSVRKVTLDDRMRWYLSDNSHTPWQLPEFLAGALCMLFGMIVLTQGHWAGVVLIGIGACLGGVVIACFYLIFGVKNAWYRRMPVAVTMVLFFVGLCATPSLGWYLLAGCLVLLVPLYFFFRLYRVYIAV